MATGKLRTSGRNWNAICLGWANPAAGREREA